ncbi:MAG: hypothetical protein AAFX79_06235 [Planctomycetota bacterium]
MKRAIQVILVLAAALAVLSLAAWGAAVWFLGPRILWAPEGVQVAAEAPSAAAVGDPLELTIRIRNDGPATRVLETIEIETDYLEGFSADSIEPPPESSEQVLQYRVYRMDTPVPAGQTTPIRFDLRALTPGAFAGRVQVTFEGEPRIAFSTVNTTVAPR